VARRPPSGQLVHSALRAGLVQLIRTVPVLVPLVDPPVAELVERPVLGELQRPDRGPRGRPKVVGYCTSKNSLASLLYEQQLSLLLVTSQHG
jgi:hypothetical protein